MNKIREILLTQYIGAITIGFVLALGISQFVMALVQCGAGYWDMHQPSSIYREPPSFPWSSLIVSLVDIALYLLIAYLLMIWLYSRPKGEQQEIDESSSETA